MRLQTRGENNVRAGKDQGIRKIASYSLLCITWWTIQFYLNLVDFPQRLWGISGKCVWRP